MFSSINRQVKRWVIRRQKRAGTVMLSDTTLRDGAQMPGLSLKLADRVAIAECLARAGLHSLDLGFAAIGAAEIEAIRASAAVARGPVLSSLARCRSGDIDAAAEALSEVPLFKKAITLFVGTSPLHREHKLSMDRREILDIIGESIRYAARHFQIISFGAEDASRTEPEFLHQVYETSIQAGATSIGFTDTVGILTPAGVQQHLTAILENVPSAGDALLAVHFHNDLGLATANSLAAVEAGADVVQGTINGIGERAGNVAIEEVALALSLHPDQYGRPPEFDTRCIRELCTTVAELCRVPIPANKPLVGANVFRTAAGIHQDGVLKDPMTYLPFPPETVGATDVELVLGAASGRNAVRHTLRRRGFEPTDEHIMQVLGFLKGEAQQGGSERGDADLQEMLNCVREHLDPGLASEQARPEH